MAPACPIQASRPHFNREAGLADDQGVIVRPFR